MVDAGVHAPDYVEPTVGWRAWEVVESDGVLQLSSLRYAGIWEPGTEVAATCRRSLAYLPWGRMPIHTAPASDCVCGIYGAVKVEHARPFLWVAGSEAAAYRVVGRVSLWGRVVQAQFGWRAEFGYPEHLYVPATTHYARLGWRRRRLRAEEVASELEAYAVPVDVVDGVESAHASRVVTRIAA